MAIGLADGMRVAVLGAGPAGLAFACSLLASARAFGKRIGVTVFDGAAERAVRGPALLDADTRARLASLGAALPFGPGFGEVQGILVSADGRSSLLEPPPGGLWIADGPGERAGSELVKAGLTAAAGLRGAQLRQAAVDRVEPSEGGLVVRARGNAETFDVAVGAFGAGSTLTDAWLEGRFRGPPRMRCSHARVRWAGRDDLLRVCVAPTPAVDLLALIPSHDNAYVVAIGEDASPHDLAQALMTLTRDRVLPGGLGIIAAERLALPAGYARRLAWGGELVVGSAAQGGPIDPGLLPALLSGTRSAATLLELGATSALPRRLRSVQSDLRSHARHQAKILKWARRARARVPAALTALGSDPLRSLAPGLGLVGFSALPSGAVLSALRGEAFKRAILEAFSPAAAPFPHAPTSEPLVYVVDDDPDVRAMLEEFLRLRGATVRSFDDEMSLLEAAARERPRAILLDIVLRWVDGVSLCRLLRRHPATARARILSMSNLNRRAERDAALAAGADAFLPKPVSLDELDRLLADVFARRARPHEEDVAQAHPG